jgi:hypothetical protein
MNGGSRQRNQGIEVESVRFGPLSHLDTRGTYNVGYQSSRCRPIENEVYDNFISHTAQSHQLAAKLERVAKEDEPFIHCWLPFQDFEVRFARHNTDPKAGIPPLQDSKNGNRYNHVPNFVVPQNEDRRDFGDVNRKCYLFVPEYDSKQRINKNVPNKQLDLSQEPFHDLE